ncbi:MAG: HAMP domain-containing protein, partial [Oscillospiraceae bacterium]|nr:HAMP domain-containing protein [Oscillospiraceae bacterium]
AAQSAIGFLSADDSGFVFSDSETNLIYKYNILTDEVISESVEQFIYNNEQLQAFDILYVGIDGKKDCAALVTATTFDKVKVHAWNDGIPIDIQKFSVPLTVALARASEFICLSFVGSVVLMLLYQVAREFIWRRRGVIFRLMGIIASFVIVSFCALGYVDLLNIHTELYEMRYKLAIELRSQVLKTMPIDMVDELCNSWSSYSEAYNAILAESELTNRRAQVLDGVEGFGCYSQLLLNKTLDESDPCLVVGPSSFNNFLYPVENLYSESACAQFYDTLKTGGIEINVLTNDCGDWIVSSSPIKNKDGKILGVLLILVDVSSLPYDIAQESLRYAMFASIIILALLLLTYFLFKKALRPLSKLEGAFESVARGDYNVRLLDEGNDEFYRINTTFNKMCEDVANSVYKLKQIKGNYDKFVSEVVFKLFGDANVNNLNIGDHFETDLIFVLQGVGDLFEAGISRSFVRIDGMNTIEFLSQLFRIANGCAVRNGGVVLASTLGFGIMRALFDKDKAREAIDYSLDVLGDIRTGFSDGEELDFVTLLHKDHAVCGIVGDDNNAFPVAGSRDVERLVKLVPKLRRVGVRTAVTRSLVDDTKKEHSVRYLGFVGVPGIERRFELFEVLDGCDVEEKNQKLLTRVIFENGIKLFYAKEFYKARTEFAKVLQKYEKDKVARWYLLVCDKYFSSKSDNISFEFLNDIE